MRRDSLRVKERKLGWVGEGEKVKVIAEYCFVLLDICDVSWLLFGISEYLHAYYLPWYRFGRILLPRASAGTAQYSIA